VFFGLAPPWSKVKVDCCGGEFFAVACGTFFYGGQVQLVQPSEMSVSDQYLLGFQLLPKPITISAFWSFP